MTKEEKAENIMESLRHKIYPAFPLPSQVEEAIIMGIEWGQQNSEPCQHIWHTKGIPNGSGEILAICSKCGVEPNPNIKFTGTDFIAKPKEEYTLEPFNLERAKAGETVCLLNRKEVLFIGTNSKGMVVCEETDGICYSRPSDNLRIKTTHKPKGYEFWINVYENGLSKSYEKEITAKLASETVPFDFGKFIRTQKFTVEV